MMDEKPNVESASVLKPGAKMCHIREQIINDPVSGLTFQFETDDSGLVYFRILGTGLPFGNREIIFDRNGEEAGAGTYTRGTCKPAWLTNINDF